MRDSPISLKAQQFTESVIREMTRLAMEHDAINLAQGFPDFAAPAEVKDAAVRAICADVNQYAITWGAREFRRAIAERFGKDTRLVIDPERELTVCCGATETMIASMLAVVDPGAPPGRHLRVPKLRRSIKPSRGRLIQTSAAS